MRYTILSNSGTVSIGTQDITTTPISLVSLKCLTDAHYSTLFTNVQNGNLIIQLDDVNVENGVKIISSLINLSQGGSCNIEYLNTDWNNYLGSKEVASGSDILEQIDMEYNKRIKDGMLFYRKYRASMVKDMMDNVKTESDIFIIDKKIKNAKDCILTGDWKTGLAYLNLETVEGAFTQEFKTALMADIQTYIAGNY